MFLEERKSSEESFYIIDLQSIDDSYKLWKTTLPRVHPHYAVKCNPDAGIIKALAKQGVNFDCASPNEIDSVMNLGICPSRILYANPCKRMKDIEYALDNGVTMTTLDSIYEVDKIAEMCGSKMNAILRVYASDPHAQCPLSNKFGAHTKEWLAIIQRMAETGVPMVGVSFHVGSGACTPEAFENAISTARDCIHMAISMGMRPSIVDIGGGFVPSTFETIGTIVSRALDTHFPSESGFTLIAEPGRLIAERAAHLMVPVIGKKINGDGFQYCISDGMYGSFNCMMYDNAQPPQPILMSEASLNFLLPSKITGPTCDSIDSMYESIQLPELDIGDWMLFPNMGAYTLAGASCFNGLPFYKIKSVYVRI